MFFASNHMYSSLQQADFPVDITTEKTVPRRTRLRTAALTGFLSLLAAVIGFVLGLSLNVPVLRDSTDCAAKEMSWSTELPPLKRSPTRFNGSFEFSGKYRGAPSPQIDREWDRFSEHPWIDGTASLIAVDEEDVERANKTSDQDWFNTTVEYGEINGGGYMATLELFHQLHCLNMLRKAIHSDYYEDMRPFPNGSYSYTTITHLDHCVEILRQVISCYGDTGLITFHWVQGNPVPYPDFNTWHQCRDPEEILAWSRAREAPIVERVEKTLFPSVVEMLHAP